MPAIITALDQVVADMEDRRLVRMHEAPKRPTGVPQTAFVPRATLPVVILSVSGSFVARVVSLTAAAAWYFFTVTCPDERKPAP